MFIGHFALGFAAQRVAPRTPFAWLIAAPNLADLIWPVLVLLGLERVKIVPGITPVTPLDFESYPWSHSLLLSLGWSALAGALYWGATRDRRGAWTIAALVTSHWVLDWISHRADMPFVPFTDTKVGLGLWYSKAATLAVEVPLFIIGVLIYLGATRVRNRMGHVALWSMVALLAFAYYANMTSPPPSSVRAVAFMTLALYLFVPWAWWVWATHEVQGPATAR